MSFQLSLQKKEEAIFADFGEKYIGDQVEETDKLGKKLLEVRDHIEDLKIRGSFNKEEVSKTIYEIQICLNEIKEMLDDLMGKKLLERTDTQKIRSAVFLLEGQVRQAELFLGLIKPQQEIDEVFRQREQNHVDPIEKNEWRIRQGSGFLALGMTILIGSALFPLLGIFAFLPGVFFTVLGGLQFGWGIIKLAYLRAKN